MNEKSMPQCLKKDYIQKQPTDIHQDVLLRFYLKNFDSILLQRLLLLFFPCCLKCCSVELEACP